MSHSALVGRALTLLRQDDPDAALEQLGWFVISVAFLFFVFGLFFFLNSVQEM